TVSVRGDTLYEPDETLLLNLSNPVNVALNNTQAVGSIINDDPKPDQPDLLIRKGTEPDSSFAIDNVYQTTPSGDQIEAQIVPAKAKATHAVRVQNNGGSTRTFLLKAAESSGVGWTVVYKSGGTVITSAIKGTGTTTSSLAPGAAAVITVEMTPGGTVAENASKSATIRAYLGGSDKTTIKDAVQAVTVKKTIKQPDGLIRRLNETDASYAEDNIYQTTPAGNQIETQTVTRGTKAVSLVKVQNDGNVSQSFTVKAAETTATGWTVAYKVGTTAVTNSIKALGYKTPVLSPGSSVIITVEMTPGSGVATGGSKSSTIRTMVGSSVLDAVQATTIVGTVASLSASVTSTRSQEKARIVWQDEPPEEMAAGMNYAVSWQVIGGWQVTHTYVVMSNSPDPSRNPTAMTEVLAGDPGLFRSWIPAPSSGGLYYQVIAVVDGRMVASEVLYGATAGKKSQRGG
ncbi:MAG: hypothetical protein HY318_16235, partial [Armatimonadetes bacterium]|nr:hypothetical protein [Armatimonadota bacterium]